MNDIDSFVKCFRCPSCDCFFNRSNNFNRHLMTCKVGGVIVSEKLSSSSIVMGFSADPASSHGKRKSSTGWATNLEFALFQVGSLWWELASYDVRWNPFASLPPCARLRLGCPFVPEKLQRLFLALGFVLDQAKVLQSKWDCCFALGRSFWAINCVKE